MIITRGKGFGLTCLFLCLCASKPVRAESLVLDDAGKTFSAGRFLSILPDPDENLTFAAAHLTENASRFVLSKDDVPNLGFTNYAHWARLEVVNRSPERSEWILLYDYPRTDNVDVYVETERGLREFHTGDHDVFSSRPIPHHNFAFPLNIPAGSTAVIYFRFKTEGTLQMPVVIMNPVVFEAQTADEVAFLFLVYGIMLAMLSYNVFLYFSVRDPSYLVYVFYIGSSIILQMAFNGMADRYLWGNWIWWADRSFVFLTIANVVLAVVFSRLFLQFRTSWPLWNRMSLGFIAFSIAGIASCFFLRLAAASRMGIGFVFVGISLILIPAVYLNIKRYRPARYFLLAWVTFLLGALVFGFQKLGILPKTFITEHTYQIGTALEVILLSLALGDRINHLKNEVLQSQARAVEDQTRIARSFERFVPKQFLQYLGRGSIEEIRLGDAVEREMTVLFCDIRGFTTLSENMSPGENFRFLNSYLKRVGPIIRKNGGFIDKYIGDGVMSLFPDAPEHAVQAAIEVQAEVREYNRHRLRQQYDPIKVGIGIHTGSLMLGTIGEEERLEGTVIADAVNLASRIEDLTKMYEAGILISQTTLVRLPDPGRYKFRVIDRVNVKGKEESVTVVEIMDGRSDYVIELFEKTRASFDKGVSAFLDNDQGQAARHFRAVLDINPNDRAAQIYAERAAAPTQ